MRAIIVGASHWHTPWHVAALRAREVDIIGIWDLDHAATISRSATWRTRAFDSVDELFQIGADLAILAPRAIDAPDLLQGLIRARIPVIAEKPLGVSAASVEALAQLAAEAGLFVAVTFVNRLSPVWDQANTSELISADFRIINGTPQRYVDDGVAWVMDPALSGGGALRNLGIHGADAVCALARDERVTVESVFLDHDAQWDAEVHALATVRSSRGWWATIEAGFTNPDRDGSDFEWRVARRDSYVIDRDSEAVIADLDGTRRQAASTSAQRYDAFIGRALNDLAAKRRPLADLTDAARAARLIDDIYAAAANSALPVNHKGAP